MNKQIGFRPVLSTALLVSGLLMLPGCRDWFRPKDTAATEGSSSSSSSCCGADHTYGSNADSSEVLLSLNGKPAITRAQFEEYWDEFLKSDPNAEALLPFMPNAREDIFNNLVAERIIQEDNKLKKKDQDPVRLKKKQRQIDLTCRIFEVQQFQEDVLKDVDTSDAALEAFYEENRDKNSAFQQPPFMVSPAGVKALVVNFTNEKQAKDFLAKAQKPQANFANLAKEAKKEVKDLGIVSPQSRSVDPAIRAKVKDMEPGSVALVPTGKNQFSVVKATAKESGKYAPFKEVQEAVKHVKMQVQFPEIFKNKLEQLKKAYNAQENKSFFEKEREKQSAELQAKLKAAQQQEKPEQPEQEQALEVPAEPKEAEAQPVASEHAPRAA